MAKPTPPTKETLTLHIYESIVAKLIAAGKKKTTLDNLSVKIKALASDKLIELWPSCKWTNIVRINELVWNCADYAIANHNIKDDEPPRQAPSANMPKNFITERSSVKDPDVPVAKVNPDVRIKG